MEKYKLVLKRRTIIFTVFIIFAVVLQLCNFLNVFGNAVNDGFVGDVLTEFQTGLLFGITIIFVYLIVRYNLIMKDNIKLKKFYNAENDERRKEIKQKSGGNVILFSSIIIIFMGIIAGYFNKIIFFSLIACALFQLSLCALLKLYYSRKY